MTLSLGVQELNALIQVSMAVNRHLDLDSVLETVMRVVTEVMDVEASSLVMIDDDAGDLLFHVTEGEKAGSVKSIRMKPGEGVVGHVVQTGAPLIVNDAQNDERFCKKVDAEIGFVTRSILCVPLQTNTRLWGAVEVLNKQNGADFDDTDLRFCQAIAAQAAIAIENAVLHRRIVQAERLGAIGQTVAGLGHCIKNVLQGITGGSFIVDLGIQKSDPTKTERGWQIVKTNLEFMNDLVTDMLTYAKERAPEYQPADVNAIVQAVCDLLAERAADAGAELVFDPAPGLGNVFIDPRGIKRCVLNLVSNAIDACEEIEGGRVTASVSASDDREFMIFVNDNGVGISRENQEKLFQIFFSTKGSRGTGFGLAVTHKIIEEHKGRIEVASAEGKGTTFAIVLPLKKAR